MNKRLIDIVLIVLALIPFIGGGLWLVHGWTEPEVSVDEASALARVGQFDQAEAMLTRYLRLDPGNSSAHLLMAQLATSRPTPNPGLALEHLRKVRTTSPSQAAVVQFLTGKTEYQRKRYDLAEASWTEAIRIDPRTPEAGFALLDLLFLEGRISEAHRLGMRLHEVAPDPRNRVQALLEVARVDVDKAAPASQVILFEPLVQKAPNNFRLAIAVGLALIHDSRSAAGLAVLRDTLRRVPDSPEAWDGWFTGLDDAGRPEELTREFARLPKALADDPRFTRHEGQVAFLAHDWARAARAFRRAYAREPYDGVLLYRLSRALRQSGADEAERQRIDRQLLTFQAAFKQMRTISAEAPGMTTLGVEPQPEFYQRMANLREQMGRPDEARAWHRLVLRDAPGQPDSLAALERLK